MTPSFPRNGLLPNPTKILSQARFERQSPSPQKIIEFYFKKRCLPNNQPRTV